jgi:hypothetical protein
MGKLNRKDLEDFTDAEIKQFYNIENIDDLPDGKVKDFIISGLDNSSFSLSQKITRVRNLLNNIIVDRFLNNKK